MKKYKFYYFLILTLIFSFSCNTEQKKLTGIALVAKSEMKDTNDILENVRETLKGAEIKSTIKNIKEFYFSNIETKDTFELIVNAGLISKSESKIKIKNSNGVELYSETFKTSYFIRDIFEPDTVPQNVSQNEYEKYLRNYVNSISKVQFEKFINKPINHFFDHIFFDKKYLTNMDEEITDKELYNEVVENKDANPICFPCFDCDEGSYILAYSKSKLKVLRFAGID